VEIGDAFLKVALVSALITTVTILGYELRKDRRFFRFFPIGVRLSAISITISMVLLTKYFVDPNFNYDYVFARTSLDTPLIYRISAVWAGQEGSFLLWTWVISIAALATSERRGWRRTYERRVQVVLHLFLLLFLSMTAASEPFASTTTRVESLAIEYGSTVKQVLDYYASIGLYRDGVGFVDGRGISPALMSPWMAIHPPLVFAAYGLLVVPFAASAVYLYTGKGDWEVLSRTYSRLAWFFLTAGIAVGSFWAYEELSYGGYWTWDPIEISSLIPWLGLTAFLHGSIQARRRKTFQVLTPLIGFYVLILIIYSTYITRSGVLKSAHAYPGTEMGKYLIVSMIIMGAVSLALGARRLTIKERNQKKSAVDLTHFTFFLAIIVFLALALLLTWGLTTPVVEKYLSGTEPPISPEFFNKKGFPLALTMTLLGGFCAFMGFLRKEKLFRLTGVAMGGTALLSFFLKSTRPEIPVYATVFIPIGVFAIVGSLYRIYINPFPKAVGSHITHLGVALLLLGVISSSTLQETRDLALMFPEDMNTLVEVGKDYSISVAGIIVDQDERGNWYQDAKVKIFWRGEEIGEVIERHINDARYGHYTVVSVFRGLRADVYPVFHGIRGHETDNIIIPLQVKVLPYVSLIWIGVLFSLIGMTLILISGTDKK
jgi:cytochrome c-type biogenesis protein CcmF